MSAIGTTGGFSRQNGPANIVLSGRTYHRMLSGNDESGPLRLFINDGSYVHDSAESLKANVELTKTLHRLIVECNPLMQEFKRLADQPSENARLELTVNNAKDLGAITISSRSGEI